MVNEETQKFLDSRLKRMEALHRGINYDYEGAHIEADNILIELLTFYGCPPEILKAYSNVGKWYA